MEFCLSWTALFSVHQVEWSHSEYYYETLVGSNEFLENIQPILSFNLLNRQVEACDTKTQYKVDRASID